MRSSHVSRAWRMGRFRNRRYCSVAFLLGSSQKTTCPGRCGDSVEVGQVYPEFRTRHMPVVPPTRRKALVERIHRHVAHPYIGFGGVIVGVDVGWSYPNGCPIMRETANCAQKGATDAPSRRCGRPVVLARSDGVVARMAYGICAGRGYIGVFGGISDWRERPRRTRLPRRKWEAPPF